MIETMIDLAFAIFMSFTITILPIVKTMIDLAFAIFMYFFTIAILPIVIFKRVWFWQSSVLRAARSRCEQNAVSRRLLKRV